MGDAYRGATGSTYKEMLIGTFSAGIQGMLISPKNAQGVDIYNQDVIGLYMRAVTTLSSVWNTVVTATRACKVEILYLERYKQTVESAGVIEYNEGEEIYNTATAPAAEKWTVALVVR